MRTTSFARGIVAACYGSVVPVSRVPRGEIGDREIRGG